MADDYPTDLTDAELAEALRKHGDGIEATADELADAIDADDPTPGDLGSVLTETLELLGLLGDTIAPGIDPADDPDTDDYRTVAHASRILLDYLDDEDAE